MDGTSDSLRDRYLQMDTEELVKLSRNRDLTDSAAKIISETLSERGVTEQQLSTDIGFQWWVLWAWLGLTFGNLFVFIELQESLGMTLALVAFNSVFMILILRYNKYAFLIATILSINPVLWIINGIYLKNRWHHPKVNK